MKNRESQVSSLYRTILNREPDAQGLEHYVNSNKTIEQIRQIFIKSEEYNNKRPRLYFYEKKKYSQNGEDGIIEHIFNTIGTTNKIAVEIGVSVTSTDDLGNYIATKIENNTMALSEKDWKLYWFDIIEPYAIPDNCTFVNKFLTKDNICECFEENNIPKEFDLLSIDIDSNDYYLRDALKSYSPRVVILEYNGCFDSDVEYIMPYDETYQWPGETDRTYGVSLKSLTKQADELGYDLIYCESNGVNAFFIRKDINVFESKTSTEAWVKLQWSYATSYIFLNNLYCSLLQRQISTDEYHLYKKDDIYQVKNMLLESQEYRYLNLEKSNRKSAPVSIPYTVISINDRAIENINRIKNIMPSAFIDDIQFVDSQKIDMESYFSNNNIKITWDENYWNRKPLSGELGCIASHLNCLKYIVENNIPELIVFEDDAILVDNFNDIFNNCYSDLPKDYDFLANIANLYLPPHFENVTDSVLINSKFIHKSYLMAGITKFMLYSYNGAKKILDAYETYGVYYPVDLFLFKLSRDKILNGYSTFFSNTLLESRKPYGSVIDPTNIRGN